jgi:S1-C subfamily serine protease
MTKVPAPAAEEAPQAQEPRGPAASLLVILGAAIGLGIAVYVVQSQKEQPATRPSAAAVTIRPEPTQSATGDDAFVPPVIGSIKLTPTPALPASNAPSASASIEDVVSAALPAVASIETSKGRGSGFFIRPNLVVTNYHVVEGQSSAALQAGGATFTARVASTSEAVDLALLEVYNANPQQPTLRLGTGATARPGEEVIAIGYALGALSNTVTRGIVSAVRQTTSNVTLIQTDAAINPGNSGGPLLDRTGTVIGINSMRNNRGEGLGFAIAVDHVMALVNGTRPAATATPLAALRQLTGGPSDSDQARTKGAEDYEAVVDWAARMGAQMDANWQRSAKLCVTASASTGGDRAWFALYVSNGVKTAVSNAYNCFAWINDMTASAMQIKQRMDEASEAARREGVYPGTLREIRQKYRLDWSGWN